MSKGDTTITYKYDDSGIRTEKKVNDKIIRYTTVDGRITSQDDGTNKLYFYYDGCDSLLGFEHNGTPYLYIRNIQGDIYGITDTSGTLLVQYEYDAWGKVKDITGNQTLGQLNPMRYRGYYYDEETGLYYLQSRYYDANIRRFINADAFEMIGNSDSYISYNLYVYCENNPVISLDYNGYGKTYVIFDNRIKKGFRDQVYKSYYFNSKLNSVNLLSVNSAQQFIDSWNSMDNSFDYLYIFVHGTKHQLHFSNGSITINRTYRYGHLKKINVKKKVYLFVCDAGAPLSGTNEYKSTANLIVRKTSCSVVASDGGVSFSTKNGRYYARAEKYVFSTFYTFSYKNGVYSRKEIGHSVL